MLASVAAGEPVTLAGPCERDILDHRLERCPETDDLAFAIEPMKDCVEGVTGRFASTSR